MIRHSPHGDAANAMEDGSPAGLCWPIILMMSFPASRLLQTCYVFVYDTVTMRNLSPVSLPVSENLINFACVSFKSDVVLTVFS